MKTARRGLAVLVAFGIVLVACGDDDSQSADTTAAASPTTQATTAASDAPASESSTSAAPTAENVDLDARLVYAHCCVPQGLDPHNQPAGFGTGWFPVFDRLTMVGTPDDPADPTINPMVAESWEFSDDGLTLTLALRDDVTFHDGNPVDAAAVKASLDRARESQYAAATALEAVTAVEVVDPATVRLVLSEPDATIPAALATNAGAVINPAVLSDPSVDLNLRPPAEAGSGPYVAETLEPGVRLVLRRAPGEYWDAEASYVAEYEILGIPDPTTRINGLRAGDYDVIQLTSLSTEEGDRLAESGDGFTNYRIDGRTVSMLWLDNRNPALADVRVRQAIAMAIDRDGIGEGALNGTCTATDSILPPDTVGFDEAFTTDYPYDLDQARALLEEAGASDLELAIVVPAGATQETIGTVVQASLQEIGINASVQAVPPNETIAEFLSGRYQLSVNAIPGSADSTVALDNEMFTRTPYGNEDPEIAELLNASRAALDDTERAEALAGLNAYIVNEQVYGVPVCLAQFSWAANENIINVDRMPWQWSAIPDIRYLGVTQ